MNKTAKAFTLLLIFLALIFISGCGTLTQDKLGGKNLTPEQINFANELTTSRSEMEVSFGGKSAETNCWASKVYPIFPVFYWQNFGKFQTPPPNYGLRTVTVIFPLLWVARDSIYNEQGERTNAETFFSMLYILAYEDSMQPPNQSNFKMGILWIPGIGPFFGVGPEFFQFFWIPFTDYQ